MIARARASDKIRALDGRAGRRAADHAAAPEHIFELALGARAHVSVDEPPLPSPAEPDAARRLERRDKFFFIRLGPVSRVQYRRVLDPEPASERLKMSLDVDRVGFGRRGNHDDRRIRPARQSNEPFDRIGILGATVDDERAWCGPDLGGLGLSDAERTKEPGS